MSLQSRWHDARVIAGYAAMPAATLAANMGANRLVDTDSHFSEIAPLNVGVVWGQLAVLAVGAAFERWSDRLPSKVQSEAVRRGMARVAAVAVGGVMGAAEATRRDGRWVSGAVEGAAAGYATARVTPALVPNWGHSTETQATKNSQTSSPSEPAHA